MRLPFSIAQFFEVFHRYHEAVFPIPIVLAAIAVLMVVAAGRGGRGRSIYAWLGVLWIWMGTIYHLLFFRSINSLAVPFGAAFVLQGVLFVIVATRRPDVAIGFDVDGIFGAVMGGFALIGYPAIGYAVGQRYPAMPTFGVPCPTTIFTFAVLTWTRPLPPAWLWVIPLVWSVIGTSAAVQLGVPEDFGLPAAAGTAMAAAVWRRRRFAP